MKTLRKLFCAVSVSLPLLVSSEVFAETALRIGLIPSEDSQSMIESSQQVLDQLQAKLGMPVKPFVATDYKRCDRGFALEETRRRLSGAVLLRAREQGSRC